MAQQLPNPYNARASQLHAAVYQYAAAHQIDLSTLQRAQFREIAKAAGLYTSEGALSRDIASMRREDPALGGMKTKWSVRNEDIVELDGVKYAKRRIADLTRHDIGKIRYIVGGGQHSPVLPGAFTGVDVARARAQILGKASDLWRKSKFKRKRSQKGAAKWSPRSCLVCGDIILTDDLICDHCADEMTEETERDILQAWREEGGITEEEYTLAMERARTRRQQRETLDEAIRNEMYVLLKVGR